MDGKFYYHTSCHIFSFLNKLKPNANLTTWKSFFTTDMSVLDSSVMIDCEIVLGGLEFEGLSNSRPCTFSDNCKLGPTVMNEKSNHRLGHLSVRRLCSREGRDLRCLVVRTFL